MAMTTRGYGIRAMPFYLGAHYAVETYLPCKGKLQRLKG